MIRSRLLKPFCYESRTISLGIPYSLHPSFSYKTLPHLYLQSPLMVVRYCFVSHVISYQFPFWYTSYGNHFISEVNNFNLQFSQANGPFPYVQLSHSEQTWHYATELNETKQGQFQGHSDLWIWAATQNFRVLISFTHSVIKLIACISLFSLSDFKLYSFNVCFLPKVFLISIVVSLALTWE